MEDSNTRIYAKGTKRNFPQVTKRIVYSLQDIKQGDHAGMTETDSDTSGQDDGQYTPINQKTGIQVQPGGQTLGTHVKLDRNARNG